jgi:hypothetical protein
VGFSRHYSIVMGINLKIIGLVAVQSVLKPFAEVSKDHCEIILVLKEQMVGTMLSSTIHWKRIMTTYSSTTELHM